MPLLDKAGKFKCRVMPAESYLGESSNKGTPYIGLPMEVIDEGADFGKHITAYQYLSEAAFDNSIERLAEVFGWDGDLSALASGDFSFEGMECSVETELEDYTPEGGETKKVCRVKWVNRLGGGSGIKTMEKSKLDSLIAASGSRAKALAANALKQSGVAPAAKREPAAAGAGKDKDGLPF